MVLGVLKSYIELMKLRVVELLLVTTVPALFLATNGVPKLSITIATLIGGTLAAGSANTFNMALESESDKLMSRTAKRPIAAGSISRSAAYLFATFTGLVSLAIFQVFTTTLATLLTLFAIAFYVVGYTILLKKNTSQNIVWGGIAGCMPVLIGQAAVTNSLTLTSWLFFLVVFFWTPPHFWALAVKYRDQYQAADFPMLPVVAPMKSVVKQMWFHSTFMVITAAAVLVSAQISIWIIVATILLIIGWKIELIRLSKSKSDADAARLFNWSITFLSIYSLLIVFGVLLK
jgi:protoheme IX farnesyltransferase